MIFIIDENDKSMHGYITQTLVKYYNPCAEIFYIGLDRSSSHYHIIDALEKVLDLICDRDYFLVTWTVEKNDKIDNLFLQIKNKCKKVICSAGNDQINVDFISPSNLTKHIDVVTCLRKNGQLASFSNYGDYTKGMYGTNITVGGEKISGSSISAAIYTGIVSRNDNPRFLKKVTYLMKQRFEREI